MESQKLKILFFSHTFYPNVGGIETISEILAAYFAAHGCEVHLLTQTPAGNGSDNFSYKIIRQPSFKTLWYEISWCDVLFENNPCIQMSWPNLFFQKPIVTGLQTWLSTITGKMGIKEQLKKILVKRSDKLIACSYAIAKSVSQKAVTIGNPYNDKLFRNTRGSRTKDFVFLGRLVSDKGAALAVQAFKIFLTNYPAIQSTLTIIGIGPEREKLEQMVVDYELEKQIIFKGALRGEPLVEALNEHCYLLVPSMWNEPFGIVVLEGMACGCIPIVSDGGGLPDAVGNAGLLFERGNADDLAKQMMIIVNDRILSEQLKYNAQEHLRSFHADFVAGQYLEIIKQAASQKNG